MHTKGDGSPKRADRQRLGKKALFYARVAPALGVAGNATKQRTRRAKQLVTRARNFRPTRRQIMAMTGAALVVCLVVAGIVMYRQKQQADAATAAKAEAARVEKQSAAAQLCYQKKTTEKQNMLGKITYDQLYDGNACLGSQQ